MPRDLSAGIIIIGNEILSGKVTDTNAPFLTRELRALGVDLKRILTIPDELDEIAAAVREFGPRYDVVLTSGGVGGTHSGVYKETSQEGRVGTNVLDTCNGVLSEYVNDLRIYLSWLPDVA
jgi:FAD synthetase